MDRGTPSGAKEELVRVIFPLGGDDPVSPGSTETMWCAPVNRPNAMRLENIPLEVWGLSVKDVVKVSEPNDEIPTFRSVLFRGGHSTYRIMFDEQLDRTATDRQLERLWSVGLHTERYTTRWIAVDVPPEVDIYEAYEFFEDGMRRDLWTFEEAHCGHPLTSDVSLDLPPPR